MQKRGRREINAPRFVLLMLPIKVLYDSVILPQSSLSSSALSFFSFPAKNGHRCAGVQQQRAGYPQVAQSIKHISHTDSLAVEGGIWTAMTTPQLPRVLPGVDHIITYILIEVSKDWERKKRFFTFAQLGCFGSCLLWRKPWTKNKKNSRTVGFSSCDYQHHRWARPSESGQNQGSAAYFILAAPALSGADCVWLCECVLLINTTL